MIFETRTTHSPFGFTVPGNGDFGFTVPGNGDYSFLQNKKTVFMSEQIMAFNGKAKAEGIAFFIPINIQVVTSPDDAAQLVKQKFLSLADKLCEEHSSISTDKGIFGGMPHIKNVRLSVGDILAKLYIYGNVQAILDIYSPDITEEQVKEAIAYAQDFLETACDPRQSPQING
jgi:uncharacterized protein (DUF433 family)